jgi:hypothetical protein
MRVSAKASSISSGYILLEHSLGTGYTSVFSRMYKDDCPATYSCSSGCTSQHAQASHSLVSISAFQQVVPQRRQQRRTRLPLEAVPRARQGEAGKVEADLLRSEGLKGRSVLKCYLSAKLDGLSGTRPRSCIAFIPRVRRSRSSLLSTSRPVSSLTRSRR